VATALVTLTWCDRHLSDKDEEVPATPMPDVQGYGLDLCEECAEPLLAQLALYQRYGAKGDRTPKPSKRTAAAVAAAAPVETTRAGKPAAHTCPGCQHLFTSRASLAAHARKDHGKSLPELEGKPVPFKCDQRGCGRAFASVQAIALHRKQAHGLAGAGANQKPAAAK